LCGQNRRDEYSSSFNIWLGSQIELFCFGHQGSMEKRKVEAWCLSGQIGKAEQLNPRERIHKRETRNRWELSSLNSVLLANPRKLCITSNGHPVISVLFVVNHTRPRYIHANSKHDNAPNALMQSKSMRNRRCDNSENFEK
jgi:hypothetical protein